MRPPSYLVASCILASVVACKNDLTSFSSSEREEANVSAMLVTQPTTPEGGAVGGVSCVEWRALEGGRLRIGWSDIPGGCGASWDGAAEVSGASTLLRVVNSTCIRTIDGVCYYDWSFDVENIDTARDIVLTLEMESCFDGQAKRSEETVLPLSTTKQGAMCRYVDQPAFVFRSCGNALMPCRPDPLRCTSSFAPEAPCESNLECVALGGDASRSVCLGACATDAECDAALQLACRNGVCVPALIW